MAQMHKRDAPTYYDIKDKDGRIVATAPASKVVAERRKLEKETGKVLRIELKGEA